MRILLVEDSKSLADSLRAGLRKLGHGVDVVLDGKQGLSYARLNPYDLLILDRMLPELDGLSVLQRLRAADIQTPVLFLTALDTINDRVDGLSAGADDYLVKPFAFEEFIARVEALSRRRRLTGAPLVEVGPLVVDTTARTVMWNGRLLDLAAREYALLQLLVTRRGETVSRIEIEDHLYDESTLPMSNAVAVAMSALRTKFKDAGAPELISTRRGLGYVFDVEGR